MLACRKKFYNKYFKSVSNFLNKDGVALIHTIGSVMTPSPHDFKYIFPEVIHQV